MNTTVLLHPSPGAGFESPFEMLAACHERVERMLDLLRRLRTHLDGTGRADTQAAEAARDVMRYFDQAAPHHHQDEERHVFPALRSTGDPILIALADRLQQDHQAMHAAWQALRHTLAELSQGHWSPARAPGVFIEWQDFEALYQDHAQVEDAQAYPAAQACLSETQHQAMGEEMARRRGVRG